MACARGYQCAQNAWLRPTWFSHRRGLRFVDAERGVGADGRAEVGGVEALGVEPVAGLVHRAGERVGEIFEVVAGGEPAIARAHLGAERMHRGVDAAGLEVEANGLGDLLVQRALELDRVLAFKLGWISGGGDFLQRGQERRELLLQVGEDGREVRRARAGLVALEQRVVAARRVAPALGPARG